jgi:GNAT superfamily N-acetyltransferase
MPGEVQIRIAEPKDVETIATLNIAMAWETERRQLNPATIRQGVQTVMDNSAYGFYVVAECDGEVVGCLLITYEWSDWRSGLFWWIQSLYVTPAFRRHGVFRLLHDFVKTQALRHPEVCGIRLYVEESNGAAQSAYHQTGMYPTSYRMYEEILRCHDQPRSH